MKYIYGSLIAIVIFIGGVFIGKYYFSKTDIQVIEKEVTKTEYKERIKYVYSQENFDLLYTCYQSQINFKEQTEKNYLYVTAFDDCKQATARYEIGTKGDWKIYAIVGGIGIIGGGAIVYKLLNK